jgi:hypothetical protein
MKPNSNAAAIEKVAAKMAARRKVDVRRKSGKRNLLIQFPDGQRRVPSIDLSAAIPQPPTETSIGHPAGSANQHRASLS